MSLIGTKADAKHFLQAQGIFTVNVNKRSVKLAQTTQANILREAIKQGYGK